MTSPIVVGGLGGSGTRVVAELLLRADHYLGRDLNRSLDNLWFTLLFRRPRWFKSASGGAIDDYMQIFAQMMLGQLRLSFKQKLAIYLAALDFYRYERAVWNRRKLSWVRKRLQSLFDVSQSFAPGSTQLWGWKEPNSHLYLMHIVRYWPEVRYVHVIRHGLDMAFSNNQTQLVNWGWYFGITIPDQSEQLPNAALEYWVKANQVAIKQAKDALGKRFYLLNFDHLCAFPNEETERFLRWLGIDLPATQLAETITPPETVGRYRCHAFEFDPGLVAALDTFGFSVEMS